MTIVNRTVPLALQTLGYTDQQIEQIEAHINEHGTILERLSWLRSTCLCSTWPWASAPFPTWGTSS